MASIDCASRFDMGGVAYLVAESGRFWAEDHGLALGGDMPMVGGRLPRGVRMGAGSSGTRKGSFSLFSISSLSSLSKLEEQTTFNCCCWNINYTRFQAKPS